MKISARSRYAIMALADLTLNRAQGPVSLRDMAHRQGLSHVYLEQLFATLRRRGLVDSIRGAKGGYKLSRSPKDVTIGCIMKAVNEPVRAMRCNGHGDKGQGCQKDGDMCITHHLWARFEKHIWRYLNNVTLDDVVNNTPTSEGLTEGFSAMREVCS